jgi:hypothetical protein
MSRRAWPALVAASVTAVALPLCAPASRAAVSPAQLALMPLPSTLLGSAAASLPLDPDSGVVSNSDAAEQANSTISAAKLANLGRITGYELDYNDTQGTALRKGHGLVSATTGIDVYRSPAAAQAGIAFMRTDALKGKIASPLATMALMPFAVHDGYGLQGHLQLRGLPTLYENDITFRSGSLVGHVSVTAADDSQLKPLVSTLASKLRSRIAGVLSGKINGQPVSLLPKPKAGPPPNGPDLSKLALSPADLGSGKVTAQHYTLDKDLDPVAAYERELEPAGSFAYIDSELALFHSDTEARYAAAVVVGAFASKELIKSSLGSTFAGVRVASYTPKIIRLGAGDGGYGVVVAIQLVNGKSYTFGFVPARSGKLVEFMTTIASGGSGGTGALETLAKSAVTRLHGGKKTTIA